MVATTIKFYSLKHLSLKFGPLAFVAPVSFSWTSFLSPFLFALFLFAAFSSLWLSLQMDFQGTFRVLYAVRFLKLNELKFLFLKR